MSHRSLVPDRVLGLLPGRRGKSLLGAFGLMATLLMADTAPSITTAPASQAVVLGGTATFTVAASGTAPLSYQWYRGDTALTGETAASLTLGNVQATDAAAYWVTVSNSAGSARTFVPFAAKLASGSNHALFVKTDGTLWATGSNSVGQLGDGTTSSRFTLEPVASTVMAVAAAGNHSHYLLADGTLWSTGENTYGQLGDGTTTARSSPVQVATDVAAVAAGANHTLFLKTDGTLWGMGYNNSGQLGDGTNTNRLSPVQITSGVSSLAAGDLHGVFLKTDGTLWGMGYNGYGQLGDGTTYSHYVPVQIASGVGGVAAGAHHTLFVKTDGTLWGMGFNYYGQLGTGGYYYYYYSYSTPTQIAAGVAAVAAGTYHSLFLRTDGTLWGMGSNGSGQLGDTTTYSRYTPVQITTGVTALAAGGYTSFFLRADATLWGMGNNANGQLGDGSSGSRSTPVAILAPGETPAWLTVITPPAITVQPQAQNITAGSSTTISVAATGSATLAYQWLKDGSAIAGATGNSLTLTNFSLAQVGDYAVTVTNSGGSVTSSLVHLGLTLPITTAQTAISGHTVNLTASAGATGTIQWQVSKDNGLTWTDLANDSTYTGVNSARLDILQPDVAMNNYLYRYRVSDGTQSITSAAATLSVIASPLNMPAALVVDKSGNLYVTDAAAQTLLKISTDLKLTVLAGKNGVMGKTDGTGSAALFNEPGAFVLADDGSLVMADTGNHTIRAVSATSVVTTAAGVAGTAGSADGDAAAATFNAPVGMAADLVGTYLIADQANHTIRTLSGGRVATLAGKAGTLGVLDGTSTTALFNLPTGLAVRRDTFGSTSWTGGHNGYGTIFVADTGNNTIRTINTNGQVSTYVGTAGAAGMSDGYRTSVRFNRPTGLVFDGDGNLYVADTGNHTIRKIDTQGYVTTYAGVSGSGGLVDGSRLQARFNAPEALAFDSARNLYVADTGNGAIRKITPAGVVSTLLILGNVPTIATQPASQTVTTGSGATFSVAATGEGTLTYQWKKDNVAINGATGASYSISAAAASDAASYTVVVTNSWGAVTSSAATLTVNAASGGGSSGGSSGGGSSGGSSGGGGGGGAPSTWCLALLAAAAALRRGRGLRGKQT